MWFPLDGLIGIDLSLTWKTCNVWLSIRSADYLEFDIPSKFVQLPTVSDMHLALPCIWQINPIFIIVVIEFLVDDLEKNRVIFEEYLFMLIY